MIASPSTGYLDRCRRPTPGAHVGAKEWHHVVVYTDGLTLLVNLSETHGRYDDGTVRVVIVAHHTLDSSDGGVDAGWRNAVITASPHEVARRDQTMRSAMLDSPYGASARFWWDHDHYRLVIDSSTTHTDADIEVDLRLDPVAVASMLTGVTLAPSTYVASAQRVSPVEKLSWFFVPRLHATGSVRIDGHGIELHNALAYHDHNWGQFAWGGDFAWEWVSAVGDGWSVTASRLLDRTRSTLRSQFLHVEADTPDGSDPVRVTFRDPEITVTSKGRYRAENVPVVPGLLRLVTPSLTEDVPELMHWSARRGADEVAVSIAPTSIVRLAIPDEVRVDGVVVLAEAIGAATVGGQIGGVSFESDGHSILELLR